MRFDGLAVGAKVRIAEDCSYQPNETGVIVEIRDAHGSLPTAIDVAIDGLGGLTAAFQPSELATFEEGM